MAGPQDGFNPGGELWIRQVAPRFYLLPRPGPLELTFPDPVVRQGKWLVRRQVQLVLAAERLGERHKSVIGRTLPAPITNLKQEEAIVLREANVMLRLELRDIVLCQTAIELDLSGSHL